MLRLAARRALLLVATAWVAASLAFLLGQWAQGDYVSQMIGMGTSPEIVARERAARGLDQPLWSRYAAWTGRLVRLDFGWSLRYERPVGPLVADRAVNTALLGLAALVVAAGVGLGAGMVTGSRPGSLPAAAVRTASTLALSCPPLLASILLVWAATVTGLVPARADQVPADWLGRLRNLSVHLPVPVLALALPLAAVLERVAAQAIAQALAEPSILAVRARGVSERDVRWRHGLRLAAAPLLAVGGTLAGALLSGSFAVELVTSWPGLGRLTIDALLARDADLAAGCTIAAAVFLAAAVLVADVALAAVDPRVRPVHQVRAPEHAA